LLRSIISSSIVGKSQRVINQVQQFLRENRRTTRSVSTLSNHTNNHFHLPLNYSRNLDVFKQRLEVLQTNTGWMQRNFHNLAQWFRFKPSMGVEQEGDNYSIFQGAQHRPLFGVPIGGGSGAGRPSPVANCQEMMRSRFSLSPIISSFPSLLFSSHSFLLPSILPSHFQFV